MKVLERAKAEVKSNVEVFKQRRNLILKGLEEIGFKVPVKPEVAFYLFADASTFTDDSYTFAFKLLEKAGVAVAPGVDFGYNETNRFTRFLFCTDEKNIEEGLERLHDFLSY